MQLTSRSRELLAICGVCLLVGYLSQASLWVFLIVPLVSLFVAWQAHAALAFRDTVEAISIEYEPLAQSVSVSDPLLCRVHVSAPTPHPSIEVTIPRAVAAETPAEAQTLHLDRTTAEGSLTFETKFAVTGSHSLPAPTLALTDTYELLTETVPTTQSPTVRVLPSVPRHVHIGQGGSDIAAFGEHETGQHGSGIQPAELRQYQPGDATRHIDWKATARLNDPYVREFEAETDRQTVILLDRRAHMGVGTEGRTMFAFGRDVAVSIADAAVEFGDPLGVYLLDADGLQAQPPASSPRQYRSVRRTLLEATEPTPAPQVPRSARGNTTSPTELSAQLAGDDSILAETIRPFLTTSESVRLTTETTLEAAIDRIGLETTGEHWSVIITPDTDRPALRAAVQRARAQSAAVSVFLTPRVLYETDSLNDLEEAYERYVDFEEFRRSLSRQSNVEAYAVTPADRLQSLLATQRVD